MNDSVPRIPSRTAPLRLGAHVLAHLRSVAEGIAPGAAARRYLLTASDEETALRAHRAAVDTAAAVARRAGLGSRWRLLRVAQLPVQTLAAPVSLEEWAEAKGYGDFSFDELLPLYQEENPSAPVDRKSRQIERLRCARLALLDDLQGFTAEPPRLSDAVALWFPEDLAAALQRAGFVMLGELQRAIAIGGRWWRGLPGYGPVKARALADQVGALVGWPAAPAWRAGAEERAQAANAGALVESWIAARTQSTQTARAYRREIQRFLVWLLAERGVGLAEAGADDCSAYIAFLRAVPAEWMSRRNAARFAPGWAPFAGQPSVASQRYALTVLNAFFAWAGRAGALGRNPWELVNLRLPDGADAKPEASRAFTPSAWAALQAQLERLPAPVAARMRWLLVFAQATGLRAAELLRARRADFVARDGGWWLHVRGKGARNRMVPVPRAALQATREYFEVRGLEWDAAHPNTPLLATLARPELQEGALVTESVRAPDADERRQRGFLTYATLAPAFKRFALAAFAALPFDEREAAHGASLHWLRHTHATRAAEKGVSLDVQQANLGHADPRTTAAYYRAQERRRMEQMEAVFGDGSGT